MMERQNSKFYAKEIGRVYNEEMIEILNDNPIKTSGLTICFDRKPDIFKKNEIKYNPSKYIGFFKKNKLFGFASIGFYKAYIMGKPETIFYFSDVYINKSARKKGLIVKSSKEIFKDAYKGSNTGYFIVLKGNKNAESYILKPQYNDPFIPFYKIIGTFDARNILITFKKKESRTFIVRRATIKDSNDIIMLLKEEFTNRLFAPYIDKKVFEENMLKRPNFDIDNYYVAEKNGIVVGVCAAWDCSKFKQTRVIRYGGLFKFTKVLYSIFSGLFNFPSLPIKGEAIKDLHIIDYAVKERNPIILNALLKKIYNDYYLLNYNTIIFGSYKSDILLKALKGFFNQSVQSHIIALSYNKSMLEKITEESSMPYIDIASL